MQAKNEMAKCLFCGNESREEFAIFHEERRSCNGRWYGVYNVCCSCGARGPDGETAEKAVELWNRRSGA